MVQDDGDESILQEAQRLTHGNRNKDYGHPLDDYGRTAALITALLGHKLCEPLTPEDAASIQILVKLSRNQNKPKRDNMVDAAGYAWVVWACTEERHRREQAEAAAALDKVSDDPIWRAAELARNPDIPSEFGPDAVAAFYAVMDREAKLSVPNRPVGMAPELAAPFGTPMPTVVTLACGCVKRCKGHMPTGESDGSYGSFDPPLAAVPPGTIVPAERQPALVVCGICCHEECICKGMAENFGNPHG